MKLLEFNYSTLLPILFITLLLCSPLSLSLFFLSEGHLHLEPGLRVQRNLPVTSLSTYILASHSAHRSSVSALQSLLSCLQPGPHFAPSWPKGSIYCFPFSFLVFLCFAAPLARHDLALPKTQGLL